MQSLSSDLANGLQAATTSYARAWQEYKDLEYKLYAMDWMGMACYMHEGLAQYVRHVSKKIAYFLEDMDVDVKVEALPASDLAASTPLAAFMAAASILSDLTAQLSGLYAAAMNNADARTFLHKAVKKQHDLEVELDDLIEKLKKAGNDAAALFMIDKKLK